MSTPYPIVRCGVRCRCPDLDAHRMPPCWFAQTSKKCLYTTPNAPGLSNQKLIFQLASENLSAKARILPLTHDRYGSRLCENLTDAMFPLLNRGGMMKGFVRGADRGRRHCYRNALMIGWTRAMLFGRWMCSSMRWN